MFFFIKVLKLNDKNWSSLHILCANKVKNLIKIKKIAFIIHDCIAFDHCLNVMREMPRNSFDIFLINYKSIFKVHDLLDIFNENSSKNVDENFFEKKRYVFEQLKK